jgi:hypothetical protein
MIFSQEDITKNLGDFHELKTYRGLNVELIKSDRSKIVIGGNRADQVVVKNVDGVLKITLKVPDSFSNKEITITIYYSEDIDIIDANEGSIISSNDVIKQNKIELKSQEAGKIILNVETNELVIKVISAGKVILHGSTESQTIVSNTGGFYNGENLRATSTHIKASSGGLGTVSGLKLVDANAKLGSTITVLGKPEELKIKESFGGYVRN